MWTFHSWWDAGTLLVKPMGGSYTILFLAYQKKKKEVEFVTIGSVCFCWIPRHMQGQYSRIGTLNWHPWLALLVWSCVDTYEVKKNLLQFAILLYPYRFVGALVCNSYIGWQLSFCYTLYKITTYQDQKKNTVQYHSLLCWWFVGHFEGHV